MTSPTTKVWIGFSTTNLLVSRLIRWVTRGKCSHAWVSFWDDTLQQYMVMQAELHGYEVVPWKRWQSKNKLVAAFAPVEAVDLMPDVRFIGQYLGASYDLKSAVWSGLKRWVKSRWRRPSKSPSSLMCSEAVCRLLQNGKFQCVAGVNPELVSPQELWDLLAKSPDFRQVKP